MQAAVQAAVQPVVQPVVHGMSFGDDLPHLRTAVPGPRSRSLAGRLARVESRNITRIGDRGPIFWAEAAGANVRDVDGNTFVDLTAGFGVAAAGHSAPAVAAAACAQARRLVHAMGDVHPADVKVELLERIAALAPADLGVSILSANGSDAVESALKTAALATGRPGVVAFRGGYHGLGYGALAVTEPERFRRPFRRQLYGGVAFAPFPDAGAGASSDAPLAEVRERVERSLEGPDAVGAVIVEPIQGRGGIIVPPPDFLPRLRSLCDDLDVLLILDEVFTGFGRTGRWFACEHVDVVPDILVVGKSLGGGFPLSAAVGRPAVMAAWPESEGEAIHTSTFLGHPVACAAALANLTAIEELGLVERAARLGERLRLRLASIAERIPAARGARGVGLMQALVLEPGAGGLAAAVSDTALRAGVIVLPEGEALAFTPPLVITEAQLDRALDTVESALAGAR